MGPGSIVVVHGKLTQVGPGLRDIWCSWRPLKPHWPRGRWSQHQSAFDIHQTIVTIHRENSHRQRWLLYVSLHFSVCSRHQVYHKRDHRMSHTGLVNSLSVLFDFHCSIPLFLLQLFMTCFQLSSLLTSYTPCGPPPVCHIVLGLLADPLSRHYSLQLFPMTSVCVVWTFILCFVLYVPSFWTVNVLCHCDCCYLSALFLR